VGLKTCLNKKMANSSVALYKLVLCMTVKQPRLKKKTPKHLSDLKMLKIYQLFDYQV